MLVKKTPLTYSVSTVNWPGLFPDRPKVELDIWHGGEVLHLRFRVEEDSVRSFCGNDRDRVWEDSCVEFFFSPSDDGLYYNIECSCTGKLYMCCGDSRHDRVSLPDEAYSAVARRPSLGTEAFGLIDAPAAWSVELDIPSGVFVHHGLKSFEGLCGRGNFYKCGDLLPRRHYLSWAPIETPKPDFHRPEFFDVICFEK